MDPNPRETRIVITSWQAMRLGAGLVIGVVFAPVVLVVEAARTRPRSPRNPDGAYRMTGRAPAGWVIATRRRRPRS